MAEARRFLLSQPRGQRNALPIIHLASETQRGEAATKRGQSPFRKTVPFLGAIAHSRRSRRLCGE